MPVFSLPDGPGIGDLGPAARRFVDFLRSAGQTIWQLLPLGPPAKGDSPYSSYSAFAGNPLLISCEELVSTGLLTAEQLADSGHDHFHSEVADYNVARSIRKSLLKTAYVNFTAAGHHELKRAFSEFCDCSHDWLTDFVRFDALAAHFGDADWSRWDPGLVHRDQSALAAVDQQLHEEMEFARFEQFVFAAQWQQLRQYANACAVRIYGDMPIFVAYESVDVWVNQDLFFLDDAGRPLVVAGVPPDYFSATGQMWGNPLYRWDQLAATNYDWWIRRFRQAFDCFDILRIDHFRGFEAYWEIPAGAENATGGSWKPGPRDAPFLAARKVLGELPIVAEDLGHITDEVHELRDRLDFPGMRVLQFGFDRADDPYHRPDEYPVHSFAYTGTHDNDTIVGWFRRRLADQPDNHILDRFVSGPHDQVHTELIRLVLDSASETAIIPMQDLLGLDSQARMNTPGQPQGNWMWRCPVDYDSDGLMADLRRFTESAGRI